MPSSSSNVDEAVWSRFGIDDPARRCRALPARSGEARRVVCPARISIPAVSTALVRWSAWSYLHGERVGLGVRRDLRSVVRFHLEFGAPSNDGDVHGRHISGDHHASPVFGGFSSGYSASEPRFWIRRPGPAGLERCVRTGRDGEPVARVALTALACELPCAFGRSDRHRSGWDAFFGGRPTSRRAGPLLVKQPRELGGTASRAGRGAGSTVRPGPHAGSTQSAYAVHLE